MSNFFDFGHTTDMNLSLFLISFGFLVIFNANLVKTELESIGRPQGCFRTSDCNFGEKCHLYVKLLLKLVYVLNMKSF